MQIIGYMIGAILAVVGIGYNAFGEYTFLKKYKERISQCQSKAAAIYTVYKNRNLQMDLLEHLISERPILFVRYIGYLVIAIVSIITALIKRNKKK